MSTVAATDATFDAEVVQSATPVVVDFWAPWCGPCKTIGPALEELAAEYGSQVKIVKVNVDENPGVASRFGVRGLPTLLVFKNGDPVANKTGAAAKPALKSWIDGAL
jgi:thioredoxin 1